MTTGSSSTRRMPTACFGVIRHVMTIRFEAFPMHVTGDTLLVVVVSACNLLAAVLVIGCLMVTDLADIGRSGNIIRSGIIAEYADSVVRRCGHPQEYYVPGTVRRINRCSDLLDAARACIHRMAPCAPLVKAPRSI